MFICRPYELYMVHLLLLSYGMYVVVILKYIVDWLHTQKKKKVHNG